MPDIVIGRAYVHAYQPPDAIMRFVAMYHFWHAGRALCGIEHAYFFIGAEDPTGSLEPMCQVCVDRLTVLIYG